MVSPEEPQIFPDMDSLPRDLEHQVEVLNFFDDLCSKRYGDMEELKAIMSHYYSSDGYMGKVYRVPKELAIALSIADMKLPLYSDVEVSQESRLQVFPVHKFDVDAIQLTPDDLPAIRVSYENANTIISVDGHQLATYAGKSVLSKVVHALSPTLVMTNDELIVDAVRLLSPESRDDSEVSMSGARIFSSEVETIDSSSHRLEISTDYIHQCGKTVLLKAAFTDVHTPNIAGIDTSQQILLRAGMYVTLGEVVDGKNIPIDKPRISHVDLLRDAIERLKETAREVASGVNPLPARLLPPKD